MDEDEVMLSSDEIRDRVLCLTAEMVSALAMSTLWEVSEEQRVKMKTSVGEIMDELEVLTEALTVGRRGDV